MSQVIIVSNRLPVSVKKENGRLEFYPSVGGLATGLSSYVKNKRNLWIGWPGIASDELTDEDKDQIVRKLARHNYSPVFLSRRQIDDFYNGYSNSVLWPLFHNLPVKRHDKSERDRWWRAYREVNKHFADAVLGLARDYAHVWIHDYQLMLVPGMLREDRLESTVGFFLHIPFPTDATFSRLPRHKLLLRGVLGADLIGFHTPAYVEAFLDSCRKSAAGEVEAGQVFTGRRVVRVADFPMGIDYEKYAGAAKSKAVKVAIRKYRGRYRGKKLIVSVDRLDPSKGLEARLKAYRRFLELNPGLRGRIVFSMVVAPSRINIPAYRNLARRLEKLVQEINEEYGMEKWQPVDYINTTLPFEEVTALFRIADVAFIAPLRDGMNLAAKEFVASARKGGALILSETAGAAEELQDALLVNPRRPDELVDALGRALRMRKRELKRRLKSMQNYLAGNTVQDWAVEFVEALQTPVPGTPVRTRALRDRLQAGLVEDYRTSGKRLLLLDYDGSLVPFTENYREATPPKSLVNLLEKLSANPRNEVVLVSGRSANDLETWFGDLPISLVPEHGAAVRKAGNKSWRTIEKVDTRWKRILQPVLEKYVRLAPGARLETKPHSLVWHYRAASPYHAHKYAVTIKRVLKPLLKEHGLEILQGNKVLEIKNPLVSKGAAIDPWLRRGYDFVLALGDDVTDEELFSVLPETAYSIKIGRGRTAARFRLASYRDTLELLKRLAKL